MAVTKPPSIKPGTHALTSPKLTAFARVHRIGQDKETYITRCIVEDTVDDRLLEMQEEKKEVISKAMDDRSVMANLTLPELLKLFGPVAYDENSKPFILVDELEYRCSKQPAAAAPPPPRAETEEDDATTEEAT